MNGIVKQAIIYCEAELEQAIVEARSGRTVLIMRFCQCCGTTMYGNPLTRKMWIPWCELCEPLEKKFEE